MMHAHETTMRDGVSTEASFAVNLCEILTREGWEQNPSLYMMLKRPDGGPAMAQFPVLDIAWAIAGDPIKVITAMTGALDDGSYPDPTGDLPITGLALACEAWALIADDDEGKATEYDAWEASGNSPADHPDGVEIRGVMLVTVEAGWIYVQQIRGREVELRRDLDNEENGEIGGRYPDALTKLLAAMTRGGRSE